MPEIRYLGCGFGLGVVLDERGRIHSVVHQGRRYPAVEQTDQIFTLTDAPRYGQHLVVPGPNHVVFSAPLAYRFASQDCIRTLTVDPGGGTVEVVDRGRRPSDSPALALEIAGEWRRDGVAGATIGTTVAADATRLTLTASTGAATPPPTIDGATAVWSADAEVSVAIAAESAPRFTDCIIIAGSVEMAAVVSSCFHDPDLYVPVLLLRDASQSRVSAQLSIDTTRQLVGAERYIFAGAATDVVEDLLWDKDPAFRSRCTFFASPAEVASDPEYAALPQLACPTEALPFGLLAARRAGARLMLDDQAATPPSEVAAGRVVCFEASDFDALVAANLAFYQRGTLVRAGTPTSDERARYGKCIIEIQSGISEIPDAAVMDRIAEVRGIVRSATQLEIDERASELTAFTSGFAYSVAYDLPISHVLLPDAQEQILREMTRATGGSIPFPLALLVDTLDFPVSEIDSSLADVARAGPALVLRGADATKGEVLLAMSLLPLSLQVIVAHGASDDRNPRSGISGVALEDGVFTEADLRGHRMPVHAGIVLNNACATWTSLARRFAAWGSLGYVGTLWPVADASAFRVGAGFLSAAERLPAAHLLYQVTRTLPAPDRWNYAYAGTTETRYGADLSDLGAELQLFGTIVLVESHMQAVAASLPPQVSDEDFIRVADRLRKPLRSQLLSRDSSFSLYLPRFDAALLVALGGRRHAATGALASFSAAIDLVDQELTGGYRRISKADERELLRYRAECQSGLLALLVDDRKFDQAADVTSAMQRTAIASDDAVLKKMATAAAVALAVGRRDFASVERLVADAEVVGLDLEGVNAVIGDLRQPESPEVVYHRSSADQPPARGGDRLRSAAESLFRRAERLRDSARLGEAKRAYERVLEFFEATEDQTMTALTHNNLATVLRGLDMNADAKQHLETALRIKQALGDRSIGNTLLLLADLAAESNAEISLAAYDEAIAALTEEDASKGRAEALLAKAVVVEERLGDPANADALLAESIELATVARAWLVQGQAMVRLGLIRARSGSPESLRILVEGAALVARAGISAPESDDAQLVLALYGFLDSGDTPDDGEAPGELYGRMASRVGVDAVRTWLNGLIARHVEQGEVARAARIARLDVEALPDVLRVAIGLAPREAEADRLRRLLTELPPDVAQDEHAAVERSLGTALKEAGDWSEAADAFSSSAGRYGGLGDLPTWAGVTIEKGNALLDGGNFDDAQVCYENGIDYYEKHTQQFVMLGRAYNNLGRLHQMKGEFAEAHRRYVQAIETIGESDDPVALLARANLTEMAAAHGDLALLRRSCEEVLTRTGPDRGLLSDFARRQRMGAALNLALLDAQLGDPDRALPALVDGIELALRRLDWDAVERATTHVASLSAHGWEDVLPVVKRCIFGAADRARQRDSTCLQYLACAAHLRAQEWDELLDATRTICAADAELALAIGDTVIATEPDHWRGHMARGLALSELERYDEAEPEYEWCCGRRPQSPVPWNNLAMDALRRGDHATAVISATRAVALEPDYPQAWQAKASAHLALGETSNAADALRRCIDLTPPGSALRRQYQKLLMQLGIASGLNI